MQHLTELLRQWFNSDGGIWYSAVTMLIDAFTKFFTLYAMTTKTFKFFSNRLSEKAKGLLVVLAILLAGTLIPALILIYSNSMLLHVFAYFSMASFAMLLFIIKYMNSAMKP